jgi:hypothetical protein
VTSSFLFFFVCVYRVLSCKAFECLFVGIETCTVQGACETLPFVACMLFPCMYVRGTGNMYSGLRLQLEKSAARVHVSTCVFPSENLERVLYGQPEPERVALKKDTPKRTLWNQNLSACRSDSCSDSCSNLDCLNDVSGTPLLCLCHSIPTEPQNSPEHRA